MNTPSGLPMPPPPPPMAPVQKPDDRPLYKKKRLIVPASIFGLFVVGSAASGNSRSDTSQQEITTATSVTEVLNEQEETATGQINTDIAQVAEIEKVKEVEEVEKVDAADHEVDDFELCSISVDPDTESISLVVQLTNNSDNLSTYSVDLALIDEAGMRVGDDSGIVASVKAGETVQEAIYSFENEVPSSCELLSLDRWEDFSDPEELAEVSCVINGDDYFGDIEAEIIATNGSSKVSDYSVTVGFYQNGMRIGSTSGYVSSVRPGESAPQGLLVSTAFDPSITCEVVSVDRSAS